MKYRVVILDRTLERLDRYLDYISIQKQAPLNAERWLKKALAKVRSLQRFPHRCPYAPENGSRYYEIRMMIVDPCLFLYNVNDNQRVVRILTFRHGSQQPVLDDLPNEI